MLVELAGFNDTCLPIAPFGVSPVSGANAIAHGVRLARRCAVRVGGAGVLGEGGWFDDGYGVFQNGLKAGAFKCGSGGETGQGGDGGENVDHLDEGAGFGSRVLGGRRSNDERDSGVELEVAGFGPKALLSEVVAVITPKNDQGVLEHVVCLQCGDDLADLSVEVADASEVAVTHLSDLFGCGLLLLRDGAKNLGALMKGDFGCVGGAGGIERRKLGAIIEIPVLFGSIEWSVGLPEADGEEKGAVFELWDDSDCFGSDPAIVIGFIRHVVALAHADAAVFTESQGEFGVVFGKRATDLRGVVAVVGEVKEFRG